MKRMFLALSAAAILAGCTTVYAADTPDKVYTGDTQEILAGELADAIRELPPETEFGAFLYCTDTCWSSPIIKGNATGISADALYSVYDVEGTDQMVGFIHSHPKATSTNWNINFTLDTLNEGPSGQDYLFMTLLATEGLVTQETTLYIVGPDTSLRGYSVPRPQPKQSKQTKQPE